MESEKLKCNKPRNVIMVKRARNGKTKRIKESVCCAHSLTSAVKMQAIVDCGGCSMFSFPLRQDLMDIIMNSHS